MEINPNFSANARNDFNFVESAKRGDQRAYAELMERYKDSIYFMALKMVNNKDDAMDITVETFGKAFENIHKYKPVFAFSTWLFRIASNNCIDFIRKKKLNMVSIYMENDDGDDIMLQIKSDILNPEEDSIKKEQREQLKIMVEKLPLRYRTLIKMRYYDELSYEEISMRIESPLGTVKAQLFRAHNLLLNVLHLKMKTLQSDF
jgi:RNA polymerase sigma factor (sigma-70 family)